jgi:hypothetical protein
VSATTFDELWTGILQANIRHMRNEKLRQVRRLRADAMSTNSTTERMASLLATELQRLTDEYISAIDAAHTKGWVLSNIDPHALTVFVQAYNFAGDRGRCCCQPHGFRGLGRADRKLIRPPGLDLVE